MSLVTLFVYIGIVAVVLSLLTGFVLKVHRSWVMSYVQHFCGVLFLVSGFVKAIDPMGTAFKMEQYFAEFERTLGSTWMKSVAGLFPWLSEHALSFSVFMIVLEMVLGVMLLLGSKPRLTAWLFLLIMLFFTALTGYTYMTAYVPEGVNFFDFAKWGVYNENNMKVKDCGCFGDFIKLIPRTSFFKDVFLMIPALYFVFRHRDKHQLFTTRARTIIVGSSIAVFFLFCLRNFVWNEPLVDFRPFRNGVNIQKQKELEEEAESKVEIIGAIMRNEKTNEEVKLKFQNTDDFTKKYTEVSQRYPQEQGWKMADQIRTEPAIPHSKISDFSVNDFKTGSEITDLVLEDPNYSFMIVSYKLKYDDKMTVTETVQDTLWGIDTVATAKKDSFAFNRVVRTVTPKQVEKEKYQWNEGFLQDFRNKIAPFAQAAKKAGVKVFLLTAPYNPEVIADFKKASGADFDCYYADDILIKTIMRSNPGVLLLKQGTIVNKWHIRQLPSFDAVKSSDMK